MNTETTKVTQAVILAGNAVLLATARARVIRERVDAIKRELLAASVYNVAPENRLEGRYDDRPERITDQKWDWLMSDEDSKEYHASLNQITRLRGLKPDDMPDEYCPALVAESLQRDAERLLLEAGGEMLGVEDFARKVTMNLDKRAEAIRLLLGLVINSPGGRDTLKATEAARRCNAG